MDTERHDRDRGLELDLPTMMNRRRALQVLGGAGLGAGLLAVAGCGSSSSSAAGSTATTTGVAAATSSPTSTSAATTTDSTTCTTIPDETAGPYPGDGSNGPDVLDQSGVVRSDIRSSFAGMSGTATGVPFTIRLKVLDVAAGCVPKAGAAVYVWHVDARGRYSLYSSGATNQNYLRGVQAVDAEGWATFTSVFPACYDGRWPHVHFEVYESLADAGNVRNKIATSQMALPQDVCEKVYADTSLYPSSAGNLKKVSLTTDMVFRDSWQTELGTLTGDVASGYVAQLDVGV
jgi:protocatechuate 3,4-dioxygenase beta subunit